MGLFSKSPEEKKLKELTGGYVLCDDFINALESYGVSKNTGHHIQKTLKEEIKLSKLGVDDIEPRMYFLIRQFATINHDEDTITNRVETSSPKERTLKFLINQNHNLCTCPDCSTRNLKTDSYCYNCGSELNQEKR